MNDVTMKARLEKVVERVETAMVAWHKHDPAENSKAVYLEIFNRLHNSADVREQVESYGPMTIEQRLSFSGCTKKTWQLRKLALRYVKRLKISKWVVILQDALDQTILPSTVAVDETTRPVPLQSLADIIIRNLGHLAEIDLATYPDGNDRRPNGRRIRKSHGKRPSLSKIPKGDWLGKFWESLPAHWPYKTAVAVVITGAARGAECLKPVALRLALEADRKLS
ncbi:hypothetical protein CU669_20150 [Paramagnetospirillum kuznetsovii]|uniref:Uncharacterized protein n=1 Tax=Paramagnetospirillum kuznetsovii TaxID=2053833 RepID=A0A364NSP3_9PROT|nr:hypothetical protein [Paramagnetospirillum kuznetsovii]RAU20096.1 hypothetical protein CU669_20150 [Paramagnetospirillum kuznetsovii]